MSSFWINSAKYLVPLRWRRFARRLAIGAVYEGDYALWTDAMVNSQGYADARIHETSLTAARAVRDGLASWERDTVLFHEPYANKPVLEALLAAAADHNRKLNVVDYGGAFGSIWWQHRGWLSDLAEVKWSVVEQSHIVEAGRREFTTGPLRFYESLAQCCEAETPTVVLLSSVLPYLESPHGLLAEVRSLGFRYVVIDRTGFVERGRDRLTVQHVPDEIYHASYPCWFFDRESLLRPFASEWTIVSEWATGDYVDIDAEHRGFTLKKNSQ